MIKKEDSANQPWNIPLTNCKYLEFAFISNPHYWFEINQFMVRSDLQTKLIPI